MKGNIPVDGASDVPPESFEQYSLPQRPHSQSDSAASADSYRSRSPTKHLGDTQLSEYPIDLIQLDTDEVPLVVQNLVHDLELVSKGVGVISKQVQKKMQQHGKRVQPYELMAESENVDDVHTSTLGHNAFWEHHDTFWEQVVDLKHIAKECFEMNAPEATWNGEVHCRLLRLSLRSGRQANNVWYRDVTTARIVDKSLIPTVATIPVQSKLVDYAMIIEPTEEMKARIVETLSRQLYTRKQRVVPSINAPSAEWIRFEPIAVSIETKRHTDYQDSGELQLGSWTIAHFLKLRQLMRDPSQDLPVLPVVYIVVHQWRLMLAHEKPGPRLNVHSYMVLGETSSFVGIYRIIAAIRRLARWVDEEYRPWLEREVLSGVKV